MARMKIGSVPSLRKHASGQAVVRLSGQDFYCGPWGTKTALGEYDRQVAEWLARGRRPHLEQAAVECALTVVELIAGYVKFAKGYYRKNGRETNEVKQIVLALKVVKGMYGREPAADFGPLKLQAVQQAMIRLGWTRRSINKQTGRVVRMYRWGVKQELVPPGVAQALREVGGLHKGRTQAKESAPVLPVEESVVEATLDKLPPIVADMVRLQRLTGCRPEEVCLIRPCDVDCSGPVWSYIPTSHKTEHHGRERVIFIGPKGQDVLRPYLLRDKASYCFCPAEGERKRRAAAHERRTTPLGQGNAPGTNRKTKPKRTAGERYDTTSYRRAIARACRKGKVPAWGPNRLRHSRATEIRKLFGLEGAQTVLGHSSADVSQIYAERDMAKARSIMSQVG